MKASTAIGIGVAFFGLAAGALMEGASPAAFLNIPALLIVIGGTFGATFAGTTIEKMKLVPTLYKTAMSGEKPDMNAQLELLVGFAERARREGLLALDEEVAELDDDFTRKGLQLVVDGTDPELVREILENEIDGQAARHHASVLRFEKAGGFAPTMGIIGTVMGLVHVLENLDAPATLGPATNGSAHLLRYVTVPSLCCREVVASHAHRPVVHAVYSRPTPTIRRYRAGCGRVGGGSRGARAPGHALHDR